MTSVRVPWITAGAAIAAAALSLIGALLTAKGNREIVRLQNKHAKSLELSRQKHLSSLVAPEKRLEAHQQAFVLWLDLAEASRKSDNSRILQTAEKCWQWWRDNCMYLDEEIDKELLQPARGATLLGRPYLLRVPGEKERIRSQIQQSPDVIRQAVGLPNPGGESGLFASEEVRKEE